MQASLKEKIQIIDDSSITELRNVPFHLLMVALYVFTSFSIYHQWERRAEGKPSY